MKSEPILLINQEIYRPATKEDVFSGVFVHVDLL